MSLFKKRPLELKAYCSDIAVVDFYPIAPAQKHIPKWWKNLKTPSWEEAIPDGVDSVTSMKSCPGFVGLYKQGFIVPAPCDLGIMIRNDEIYIQAASDIPARFHSKAQHRGWLDSGYQNAKVFLPWHLVCNDPSVDFLLAGPQYLDEEYYDDFFIPSGVTNFRYARSVHWHLMLRLGKDKEILIPAGRPLWHIIPLTNEKINLSVHHETEESIKKLAPAYQNAGKFFYGGFSKPRK